MDWEQVKRFWKPCGWLGVQFYWWLYVSAGNSASRTASCLRSPSFSSAIGSKKSLFIWYGFPYLSSLLLRLATAWYEILLISVHSCRYFSLISCHFILRIKLNFMDLDFNSEWISLKVIINSNIFNNLKLIYLNNK